MLSRLVVRTPLLAADHGIFLKPENLQPFGSYKIRGVARVFENTREDVLKMGVAAASAGNMAQALAFGARHLGFPCRIFVPESAPEVKKCAIRELGAEVIEKPYGEVWDLLKNPPGDFNGLFVHPALNEDLLEGYSSIATELLSDAPDIQAVVVPFGVGGLLAAVGRKLKQLRPGIEIFACEPEISAPLSESLRRGHACTVTRRASIADAIGTPEVLPSVFARLQPIVAGSITVSEKEIRAAIRALCLQQNLFVEPSAAAAYAAARVLVSRRTHHKIACILTGGNIGLSVLTEALAES